MVNKNDNHLHLFLPGELCARNSPRQTCTDKDRTQTLRRCRCDRNACKNENESWHNTEKPSEPCISHRPPLPCTCEPRFWETEDRRNTRHTAKVVGGKRVGNILQETNLCTVVGAAIIAQQSVNTFSEQSRLADVSSLRTRMSKSKSKKRIVPATPNSDDWHRVALPEPREQEQGPATIQTKKKENKFKISLFHQIERCVL